MRVGDLVRFKEDNSYGVVTAVDHAGGILWVFVEWLDGKLGWHRTDLLEIINESG